MDIPRPEHPRPQFERRDWLNGVWWVQLSWLERLVVVQKAAGSNPVIHPSFCFIGLPW